jgi:FAD/FMN-containing dehydrogenase/Fe-S oxidoreductase
MSQAERSPRRLTGLQEALSEAVQGEVRFDKVSRAIYSTDASVYQILPVGVVVPSCPEDVRQTLAICRKFGVSITARGGGTSQAGQAVGAGIQLDFSKYMNRILEVDPQSRKVRVEPGIVLDELNAKLNPHNLHLPLDLSTANRATIGGMIANNSSGTRSVIYGKTLDYVHSITALLSNGDEVKFAPTDREVLESKRGQTNFEWTCYRTVDQLARENEGEIRQRFPKIMRRVGGYNLDEFTPDRESFNLARLLVGSEGTLALTLDATLHLVPYPAHKIVGVVQFRTLLDAMAATPVILEHAPSAVELIDQMLLNSTQGKSVYEPLRDFIQGDPGAILIVEFFGDSPDQTSEALLRLEEDLGNQGMGEHFHHAVDSASQERIWKLRKAALGLSMSQKGDAKSISYVEDTAVAPDRLREYVARFQKILADDDTEAGFYGHASVGLLHIRPVVNMKIAAGIQKFERIANRISDLVLEFGGALSGEHGDGLARSPFQKKMFGPILYEAFCKIKQTFDPEGLFNPGKIVEAPPLTQNLKFGLQYETKEIETAFDFSDFGGLSRAVEQCGGVGACRKTLTGTMCPSYALTREEKDSTRGRANALRHAISGQLGPTSLTDLDLYETLDLCLECKACKTECPTGVDMARIKSEFLHHFYRDKRVPLRARVLGRMAQSAAWGSRLAPASNWLLANPIARAANEMFLGLDRRRVSPAFARQTLLQWWKSGNQTTSLLPDENRPGVAIFPDTFTNYFEPEQGIAAIRFAQKLGVHVVIPESPCCGRPLISKGLLDEARKQATLVTETLGTLAESGTPIVFCEPSCYSAVRDDHPNLVPERLKEPARQVAKACLTFEEWANLTLNQLEHDGNGGTRALFRVEPTEILLHGHCHQKALVGMDAATALLARIPESEVTDLDSGCCGMAGSFGYEKEHYEISRAVGEQRLFPAIRAEPEAVVVAAGFSCRHQISHFTGAKPVSPSILMDRLLEMA